METLEISATDHEELERLTKIKEREGWQRKGEPEIVHPTNSIKSGTDQINGIISFVQIMVKNDNS